MEGTLLMLSEQDPHILWRDRRQSVRTVVDFRMIAADKAGLANGQVIDIMIRGCGLRLTKPLNRGQYLTLKVYPNDGTASVQCDLAKVLWVEEERAGVAFLSMSRENELGCTDSAAIGSDSRSKTRCSRNVLQRRRYGAGVFSYRAAAKKCCQPRFTADGAVALVAPGAKGFFEPGLGNRGKLRVSLAHVPQMPNAAWPAVGPPVAAGIARKLGISSNGVAVES